MKNFILLLSVFVSMMAHANVRLPNIISSNMVLQQSSNVRLWGWAEPGEMIYITTSWNNKTDSVKGDGHAKWQIKLPTPKAGGPYTITLKGQNTIVLENVLVGEVWVCSGQSNMEMNYYWGLPQMKEDIPVAANPNLRFFHIARKSAEAPQENSEGAWMASDTNNVKWFSAVAYYFGKKLYAEMNVPIGLVHASWGGIPAEAFTPAEIVNSNERLKSAAAKQEPKPWWPVTPGLAYNAMIAPLTNYNIAGAIWYQGESNTGTARTYKELFSAMIQSWRNKWNNEFPFYYVQLAPHAYGNRNIAALLREAQQQTLSVPKTGMVVTTDLAHDTADIHPIKKRDVGYRLANLALHLTYVTDTTDANSPMYSSMQINKNKVTLHFQHAQYGLQQQGKVITGFSIAGADKVFYPAEAAIKGNTIVVTNKTVAQPVAVRYAFSNTAIGNVFNKIGLPLAPFRTDDWEVDTSSIK
ncbi:sialate O-acetylesterase [Aridibaculum aurantiacum]|uniref:sialate O-acetylesterase n=1 Tax=Aridibaculum aurantiacum TaxID=2810307 RepID=UPI001A965575|nr:sialate O-acetylesterase [Aridibaculum aurantiacum]